MRKLVIYVCLLTGLFYFSEGKPCPQKTRPHKTRCDAYYKCRELPSSAHVWVPAKCVEGLVYEHNVGTCVLPGDDWECLTASELATTSTTSRPNQSHGNLGDILIANDEHEAEAAASMTHSRDDDNVQIVLDGMLSSEEVEDDGSKPERRNVDSSQHISVSNFDSSGDGELVDLDGFLPADNHDSELTKESKQGAHMDIDIVHQQQQTQVQQLQAELKQAKEGHAKPSADIDPNLTAHLQRLSQLIDGLKQTYQKTDKPQMEMRPDQLNAFLAHFDIKNHFDTLNPEGSYKASPISSTTPAPVTMTTMPPVLPVPTINKTRLQEHLGHDETNHSHGNHHNRMHPETKVVLSSGLPLSLSTAGTSMPGYANSQIVVNRPEGSVLFTLPQYGMSQEQMQPPQPQPQPQQQTQFNSQSSHEYGEPKISEETLKTVLELSKQMIAAQNMPKVIPSPGYNAAYNPYYAQPIIQPVIFSPHNNPFQQYYAAAPPMPMQQSYEKTPSSQYAHRKRPHHGAGNKPSTTIIHNNVIPVHVSSTNSGEKEVLDNYGNSLGKYPPLNGNQADNNYYNSNKFLTTITTARPAIAVTTMATQFPMQYADAPYASKFTLTTARPFERPPSPATVASYYTPSPHLNDRNVNRVFQAESYPTMNVAGSMSRPMDMQGGMAASTGSTGSGSYQMEQRPNAHAMFPPQLSAGQVKIRPNSQKIESMEMEADEMTNANYVNHESNGDGYYNNNGNGNSIDSSNNNNAAHVLTYSSSSSIDGPMELSMSHQLAPASYVDQNYAMNAASSRPYVQRPTMSTTIYNNIDDSNGNANLDMSIFSSSVANSKPKYPAPSKLPANAQLVNFGGHFMGLDVFQKTILPLMTRTPSSLSQLGSVEVITCQAGVRQPNVTDCTRYFVCSKKDGKVLSYSCPPYTGFNTQTRICDAQTYAQCGEVSLQPQTYSIDDNKHMQMETLKMLAEAKRRQEAALKAQTIANMLQHYGTAGGSQEMPAASGASIEKDMLDSYMASMSAVSSTQRPPLIIGASSSMGSTGSTGSGSSSGVKKRKYYCKEGDKIPDQTSISNYFVCYKNAQGQMKGHKMTCSKGLLFCPKTLMCTLASKCN